MEEKLSSVHDCLQRAALNTQAIAFPSMVTIRMDEDLKQQVMDLCERNGTTISEYIRQACRDLINDYYRAG